MKHGLPSSLAFNSEAETNGLNMPWKESALHRPSEKNAAPSTSVHAWFHSRHLQEEEGTNYHNDEDDGDENNSVSN